MLPKAGRKQEVGHYEAAPRCAAGRLLKHSEKPIPSRAEARSGWEKETASTLA